jgi:hypothetical protein
MEDVRFWHFSDIPRALTKSAVWGIVLQKSAACVQHATIESKKAAA